MGEGGGGGVCGEEEGEDGEEGGVKEMFNIQCSMFNVHLIV
jgi:hypothetical protein